MAGELAKWVPLESNPEVLNKYVTNLGVSTDKFEFVDIYGLDKELLDMVPKPVLAILLLFPITKNYIEYQKKFEETADPSTKKISPNVYYTKQRVKNACGTIAIIHALANNAETLNIDTTKSFGQFLNSTKSMTPEERAEHLKADDSMKVAHQESAQEGQTETPDADEDVDLHFIAFVEKDGSLYELDGGKEGPINHGPTTRDNFLEDTSKVITKLFAVNPEDVRFNLIGLCGKSE